MASDIAICNSALIKLGASTIISLDDDNERATVLKLRYPMIRDAELRRRRWRFSLARKALAADVDTPISPQFTLQYTQPANCLRVLQVGDFHAGPDLSDYRTSSSAPFSIEAKKILTSLPAPLNIRYIQQITDPGLFDSAFVESFASRIAYECCERITQSDSKKQSALLDYRLSIREATAANALEMPPESIADDTWVLARLG